MTFRATKGLAAAALLAIGVAASPAGAAVFIHDAGTGGVVSGANSFLGNNVIGWRITVGDEPLSVSALGTWDENQDGLLNDMLVGVWETDSATLLGQVTVSDGGGAALMGEFRYANLASPIILERGQSYTFGSRLAGPPIDNDPNFGNYYTMSNVRYRANVDLANVATMTFAGLKADGVLFPDNDLSAEMPDQNIGDSTPIMGPNFEFSVLPPGIRRWIDPAGGNFETANNWLSSKLPTVNDYAFFDLASTYTVNQNADTTNRSMRVVTGNVTLDLGGNTYTLIGRIYPNSPGLRVDASLGEKTQLTLSNGTLQGGLNAIGEIAPYSGGNSKVTVNGDATWNAPGGLLVGGAGNALLDIQSGGTVNSAQAVLANTNGFTGNVDVGNGASWDVDGQLIVGQNGQGDIDVDGGTLTSGAAVLGQNAGASGIVSIINPGGSWNVAGDLTVGAAGSGTIALDSGGLLTNTGAATIGSTDSGVSSAVSVNDATWRSDGLIDVADQGAGTLLISNGAAVEAPAVRVGFSAETNGVVQVSGEGSLLDSDGAIWVGLYGEGDVDVSAGGDVSATATQIGLYSTGAATGVGTLTITGAGSTWMDDSFMRVGTSGQGTLNIEDGGHVQSASGMIAYNAPSTGQVTVGGAGATWDITGAIAIGQRGDGTLSITDGGLVRTGGDLKLSVQTGSSGTVNLNGGTLDLSGNDVVFGDGAADFSFTAGTLTDVGTFGSNLNQQGGTLQIGSSPGITTITGDYILADRGVLEIEIFGDGGAAGVDFDQLIVQDTADLAGLIQVLLDGYAPGLGDQFQIVQFGSFVDADYAFDFSQAALGRTLEWDTTAFELDGIITVVPEPGSLGLLVLGGVVMLRRRA